MIANKLLKRIKTMKKERYRNDYPDWMDEHDRDVHNEGMNAYYSDLHFSADNPYPRESRDHLMWINGYTYASDLDIGYSL